MSDDTILKQQLLDQNIEEMQIINAQLANLMLRKEELTNEIIGVFDHEHEGQKTYKYNMWKIEIKTPCVYSLNKKMYESKISKIPSQFNPIKQSVSYSIDKRLCDQYIKDAPKKVRDILVELIEKKPGKSSVCIKENI